MIGVPVGAFWICGDHPCGEDVLFGNNNEYYGYVSNYFNKDYDDESFNYNLEEMDKSINSKRHTAPKFDNFDDFIDWLDSI